MRTVIISLKLQYQILMKGRNHLIYIYIYLSLSVFFLLSVSVFLFLLFINPTKAAKTGNFVKGEGAVRIVHIKDLKIRRNEFLSAENKTIKKGITRKKNPKYEWYRIKYSVTHNNCYIHPSFSTLT